MKTEPVKYEAYVRYVVTDILPDAIRRFRNAEASLSIPSKVSDGDLVGIVSASFFLLVRQVLLEGTPDADGSWKRIADALRSDLLKASHSLEIFKKWVDCICDHYDTHPGSTWNRSIHDYLWQATYPQCQIDSKSPSAIMLTYLWTFMDVSRQEGIFE